MDTSGFQDGYEEYDDVYSDDLSHCNFSRHNLRGVSFRGQNLTGTNLSEANLQGAILTEANLSDAILINANLICANLTAANLWNANFKCSDLREAILESVYQHHDGFDLCDDEPYLSREYRIYVSKLKSEIDFSNANLSEAILIKADLSGANLQDAKLKGADLSGANLSNVNLQDADLRGADLSGANLSNVNLQDADLRGADLSGANLSNANLQDANLKSANLTNANLINANLTEAELRDAILKDANLEDTDLSGANLDGTILSKTVISGTSKIDCIKPLHWITPLQAQQADFIQRLESDCLLHCKSQELYSELIVISGSELDNIDEYCLRKVIDYRNKGDRRTNTQIFEDNLKGKLAELAVKRYLGDLITPVDLIKQKYGDGGIDFKLTTKPDICIQVKASKYKQWRISSQEREKNKALVCIFLKEEFHLRQAEYSIVIAGFLPLLTDLNESEPVKINQLLYGGGLRSYLTSFLV